MTWSIVARDEHTGGLGIAVASRFFAVGAITSHVESGVGAIASQALLNPYLGIHGLKLLETGIPVNVALDALVAADAGIESRQLHMVDAGGRTAAYTGPKCVDWSGHLSDESVSAAGNMLAGPEVVSRSLEAFQAEPGRPFAERLLSALDAGERAGGDNRGKQAAGLLIYDTEGYAALDLRVDDHPEPVAELWRLYQVAHQRHLAYRACMPTRADPKGVIDRETLDARIDAWLEEHGNVDFSRYFNR